MDIIIPLCVSFQYRRDLCNGTVSEFTLYKKGTIVKHYAKLSPHITISFEKDVERFIEGVESNGSIVRIYYLITISERAYLYEKLTNPDGTLIKIMNHLNGIVR